jgi:hypothetical protein
MTRGDQKSYKGITQGVHGYTPQPCLLENPMEITMINPIHIQWPSVVLTEDKIELVPFPPGL